MSPGGSGYNACAKQLSNCLIGSMKFCYTVRLICALRSVNHKKDKTPFLFLSIVSLLGRQRN